MAPTVPASARTASRWASSSGPGSITRAGPVPTIQVLVPSSVMGPGFGARTLRTGALGFPAAFTAASCQNGHHGLVADGLKARLRRRIEESGPITFADFMEAALYDSD